LSGPESGPGSGLTSATRTGFFASAPPAFCNTGAEMPDKSSAGLSSRELLADFPIVVSLPVQWGEQDLFGHVNNIVYFRWLETARIAYLERIGMSMMVAENGVGPILAAIRCDFRRPVTYPDTVLIGARVTRIGNSSFQMEHNIISQAENMVVAEADSTLVFLDYRAQASLSLPDSIRRAISELEGRDFEFRGQATQPPNF